MTTTSSVVEPGVFPVGGRRLVVYVVYDRRGGVDDYIPVALAGLRADAARILVVVNGALTDEGRRRLEPVADEILVRDNVGFDIWAHKVALDHVGAGLALFDEVVLTNDTWFGPVRAYGPVFERMGARAVHFWGMTDHAREVPNPFTKKGVLPYHLQSYWIAVRREMFSSPQWEAYWRGLPVMESYFDAVLEHEAVFTEHFTDRGYTVDVAYGSDRYPTDHPALFNADLLLDDGCPTLKRRPFFHYPPFLDRHAVVGRRLAQKVASFGFPMEVIWQNLARNVAPKILNTDAGMLEVLPTTDDGSYDPERPFRTLVIAHVERMEDVAGMLPRLRLIPGPFDLVVTSEIEAHADGLRATVEESLADVGGSRDLLVVPAGSGRDMSAFFVGCRDRLRSGAYDIVVKVHTRTPRARSAGVSNYFRRYQLDNLIGSGGYVRNLLALFQREPGLGLVFPPMIHIGYATMGHGWSWYRTRAADLSRELGIDVPFDGVSPLAPLGGMWVARPEALRILTDQVWSYTQYRRPKRSKVPSLAKVQERLVTYAAAERGFHVRTVIAPEHASLSHVSLEYELDQMASTTPGYPIEQIQFLHRAGWVGTGGTIAFLRMYMRMNHPAVVKGLDPVMLPLGLAARRIFRAARTTRDAARRMVTSETA